MKQHQPQAAIRKLFCQGVRATGRPVKPVSEETDRNALCFSATVQQRIAETESLHHFLMSCLHVRLLNEVYRTPWGLGEVKLYKEQMQMTEERKR